MKLLELARKGLNKLRGAVAALAIGAGAAALAPASYAQTTGSIDTSSIVTTITDATTNVAAIGGAVLSVLVVAMVFKWVRKAF